MLEETLLVQQGFDEVSSRLGAVANHVTWDHIVERRLACALFNIEFEVAIDEFIAADLVEQTLIVRKF